MAPAGQPPDAMEDSDIDDLADEARRSRQAMEQGEVAGATE